MRIEEEKWGKGRFVVARDNEGNRIRWAKLTGNKQQDNLITNNVREGAEKHILRGTEIPFSSASRIRAQKVFESYEKKISKYPTIKELKARFRNTKGKLNHVNNMNIGRDRKQIMHAYASMLEGTMDKEQHEKNMEILKQQKARETLIKKRMSVSITLLEGQRTLAVIEVYGVLLEQSNNITEFWVGRTIDSNSISELAQEFKEEIRAQEVRTAVSGKHGVVTGINTEWGFA